MGGEGVKALLPAAGVLYPQLNPIEGVWRRLKGYLMPRRFKDSLAEQKRAVLSAFRLQGAVEVQSQAGRHLSFH